MDDNLQQGIAAFKAGDNATARKHFVAAVKQNADDERAWGWMYSVCEQDKDRVYCLKQMLRINPKNEKASELLAQLTAPELPPMMVEQKQTVESVAPTPKPVDPKQTRNMMIGLGAVLLLCLCSCVFLMSLGGKTGPKDYKTMAFIQCQLYVEQRLRSPSTADFPPSSTVNIQDLGDNTFEIKSYVDAKNAFNAVIRNYFHCKIQYTGGQANDESDGKNWNLLQLDVFE